MNDKPKNREEIVKSINSKLIVLFPDGREVPVSQDLASDDSMKDFSEMSDMIRAELGNQENKAELPSIKAMQRLELVDYEPASDQGHFRFYPKGALMFDLLKAWAEEIAIDRFEAFPIETPIIYDWSQPDIRGQAESFHERHYVVLPGGNPDQPFILRFAGDFGLFRMMRDAQITYKHLPIRLFEFAPSFRYEQSGELSGLKRLRGFWMPDIHSFTKDLEQGISEYKELFRHFTDLANATGVQYAVAFRIVESFYLENRETVLEMARYCQRPIFIELLSDMKHYWVMKHEMNSIDGNHGVCQISTVQLDVKDASLYGINYVDQAGEKKGCTIVHSSIGSIERWVFALLEDALKKPVPVLPLWLSPIQLRILPVSERHLQSSLELAEKLKSENIRVDVDDRSETLGRRIRSAEKEWIPYAIIYGDKEMADGSKISVRMRAEASQATMSSSELVDLIRKQTKNMPFKRFSGMLVSKRPIFRGTN